MADRVLVEYIKEGVSRGYSLESLKEALIEQGYSHGEVNDAVNAAYMGAHEEAGRQIPVMRKPIPAHREITISGHIKGRTILAAISYIFSVLTGLVVYFAAERGDRFTRFHALQAIYLGIGEIVAVFIFSWLVPLIFFPEAFDPVNLLYITSLSPVFQAYTYFSWAVTALFVILNLAMAFYAYHGRDIRLPIVGKIAEERV